MSQISPGTYTVGNLFSTTSEVDLRTIRQFFGHQHVDRVHSFDRLYHGGTLYHSVHYDRGSKRNSSVCCYRDSNEQRVGVIQNFVLCSSCLVLVRPFEIYGSLIKSVGDPGREILQDYSDSVCSSFLSRSTPCLYVWCQLQT